MPSETMRWYACAGCKTPILVQWRPHAACQHCVKKPWRIVEVCDGSTTYPAINLSYNLAVLALYNLMPKKTGSFRFIETQ